MTTNQALIDALRERAAKIVPLAQAPDLLQLAQVATLCTQAEDLVSAEHRNQSMESARQDADPLRKFGSALDQPPGERCRGSDKRRSVNGDLAPRETPQPAGKRAVAAGMWSIPPRLSGVVPRKSRISRPILTRFEPVCAGC